MKTLRQIRKRLAHHAIGPLVGALLAGLLLIVLMFHINNGERNSIGQDIGKKKVQVGLLIDRMPASDLG